MDNHIRHLRYLADVLEIFSKRRARTKKPNESSAELIEALEVKSNVLEVSCRLLEGEIIRINIDTSKNIGKRYMARHSP